MAPRGVRWRLIRRADHVARCLPLLELPAPGAGVRSRWIPERTT